MPEPRQYDAIVVGSGIGGLAAAAVLARLQHKRVLVLERHYVAGGFTHEFRRSNGRKWDVGVHYVGELHPGSAMRAVFDYVSDGRLRWQRMPEPYDRLLYPDFSFDLYGDPARYRRDLCDRFPVERPAIERYFRDLRAANRWGLRLLASGTWPGPIRRLVRGFGRRAAALALMRTQDYFDRAFRDPRLKAVLGARWRTHGLPPTESAFLAHAVIANHYLHGAYYPVGGASAIARAIIPVIERQGGRVLIRHEVTRVLVEDGRACGVEVEHRRQTTTYRAPVVISDVGAINTYGKLIPEEYGRAERAALAALPAAPTGTTLYLGLRESPAALGLRGENYWIGDGYEHDRARETAGVLAGSPPGCYLSFPSLKDPEARGHTAEILALPDYAPFARWAGAPCQKRGAEYAALKRRIAEGMLAMVEHHLPGFRALIDYQELSTPLSVERFVASPAGAIYGLPTAPERFRQDWLGTRTPIRSLHLAGADVYFLGVVGALMGGVAAAGATLGALGFPRVMAAVMRAARRGHRPAPAAVVHPEPSLGALAARQRSVQ